MSAVGLMVLIVLRAWSRAGSAVRLGETRAGGRNNVGGARSSGSYVLKSAASTDVRRTPHIGAFDPNQAPGSKMIMGKGTSPAWKMILANGTYWWASKVGCEGRKAATAR